MRISASIILHLESNTFSLQFLYAPDPVCELDLPRYKSVPKFLTVGNNLFEIAGLDFSEWY